MKCCEPRSVILPSLRTFLKFSATNSAEQGGLWYPINLFPAITLVFPVTHTASITPIGLFVSWGVLGYGECVEEYSVGWGR